MSQALNGVLLIPIKIRYLQRRRGAYALDDVRLAHSPVFDASARVVEGGSQTVSSRAVTCGRTRLNIQRV